MSEDTAPAISSEAVLDDALAQLEANARQQTDGIWLEYLTQDVAVHLRDWNVDGCWRWPGWPEREEVMPGSSPVDDGIDLVARRRDGGWIAIQVKSRKLDERGEGSQVASAEVDKFLAMASNVNVWAERWMVVNGAVSLGGHSPAKVKASGLPLRVVNVAQAVQAQRSVLAANTEDGPCPHCEAVDGDPSGGEPPVQTRSCMQREAVETAVAARPASLCESPSS